SRAILDQYCVSCHNERLKTGGLALDALDLEQVETHADIWEKVVRKLRSGSMPPPGRPRPDAAAAAGFVDAREDVLDQQAAAHPNPGRTAIHRLNRVEYSNAIRDLLAVDFDGRSVLPPDDASYGFDNIADALTISPVLMERYVSAAATVSRLALGNPGA